MVPLQQPSQRGGPILSLENIKSIFGNIPDILAVHTNIKVQVVGDTLCHNCISDRLRAEDSTMDSGLLYWGNIFRTGGYSTVSFTTKFPLSFNILKSLSTRPCTNRLFFGLVGR